MKSFLRLSALNAFSLYLAAGFFPGLIISQAPLDILWAGIIFTFANTIIKPVIKLFLLPINLLTLGLFRWITNVIILFILTRLIPTLQIIAFQTNSISRAGFTIPNLNLNHTLSLIIGSFLLSLIFNLLEWLLEE